jgi:DNA-binding NarL/FixJ family response regulator
MKPIRVLIVDDHEIVREGLQILLSEETDFEVVGVAGDSESALALATLHKPDVVLMDIVLPRLMELKQHGVCYQINPSIRVLVLTSFSTITYAMHQGGTGYLLQDVLKQEL